jgi:hypothetical protein
MLTRGQASLFVVALAGGLVVALAAGLSISATGLNTGWYALGLMVLIGVINMFAAYEMSREIRRNYPELYNEIGRPALSTDRSTKEQWRFVIFLFARKYASIGSRKIRLLGDVFWLSTIAIYFLFVYLAVFHPNDFHN